LWSSYFFFSPLQQLLVVVHFDFSQFAFVPVVAVPFVQQAFLALVVSVRLITLVSLALETLEVDAMPKPMKAATVNTIANFFISNFIIKCLINFNDTKITSFLLPASYGYVKACYSLVKKKQEKETLYTFAA
jgi:hypothetical protein